MAELRQDSGVSLVEDRNGLQPDAERSKTKGNEEGRGAGRDENRRSKERLLEGNMRVKMVVVHQAGTPGNHLLSDCRCHSQTQSHLPHGSRSLRGMI